MPTSHKIIESAVDALQKHPVRYLVVLSVLLIASIIATAAGVTALRYRLQRPEAHKLERTY